jgi:hypothetical protein
MTKRAFDIIKLEERIAPTAKPTIPSVNPDPNVVGGAEHGLKGLNNSHASADVIARHSNPPATT